MEDQNFQGQQSTPSNNVSFPTIGEPPKKSNAPKTLLIAGILILVGILGFVIFKSASEKSDTISIESSDEDSTLITPSSNATPSPMVTPTSSPSSSIAPKASSKSSITIDVQNGTGITGEAAYLQNLLKDMGYSKISVSNASTQDGTTTIATFSKSISSDISDEITKKLQSVYSEVSVKTSSTQLSDVVIVTGSRKGSSPKVSPTAKPTASPAN